jgi:Tol biopolymer transport system component
MRRIASLVVVTAIVTMGACGGDAPQTTNSADAARIAAMPQNRQHLVLIRPDGTDATDIFKDLPVEQFRPDWSRDGSRLAFENAPEGAEAPERDVWISDADGGNPEPLVTEYPKGLDGLFWARPAWSPDGDAIAMIGYEGNERVVLPARSVLAVVDVETRELSVVGEYRQSSGYLHNNPRWSPDGRAFVLTLDHFRDKSYRGAALAIIRRTSGGWSEPDLITDVGEQADHADWHPTKDLIVFCTNDFGAAPVTDGASNLFTIRPDGTALTQLTYLDPGADRATQPTWTSDGRIIFTNVSGTNDENQRPAFINADGTGIEIVDAPENLSYPRLQPTPSS